MEKPATWGPTETPRSWQRPWKPCWMMPRRARKWDGAGNSAWKTNSSSAFLRSPFDGCCASYANPERHAILCAVLRIWRTAGEGGGAGRGAGAARLQLYGAIGGLGI